MQPRLAARLVVAASLLAALAGCSDAPSGPGDDLRAARRRWEATRPAAYAFTFQRVCFCPTEITRPTVVTVRNGAVESLRYADDGAPVDGRYASLFPTIDGLFDAIDQALERPPASFDATYDADRGYPVRVDIDPIRDAVDEEVGYRVRDWRTL
jgi:hypothetical protein